jgi:hypothetical protein
VSAHTCECGHSKASHSSLRFNCLATHDGSHATRCGCSRFISASRNICDTCDQPYVVPADYAKHPNCPGGPYVKP